MKCSCSPSIPQSSSGDCSSQILGKYIGLDGCRCVCSGKCYCTNPKDGFEIFYDACSKKIEDDEDRMLSKWSSGKESRPASELFGKETTFSSLRI
jgi:hypothetical protein